MGQDYVQLNVTTMLTGRQRIAGRGTDTGDSTVSEEAEPAYESPAAEMKVSGFENSTAEAAKEEPGFGALAALFAAYCEISSLWFKKKLRI